MAPIVGQLAEKPIALSDAEREALRLKIGPKGTAVDARLVPEMFAGWALGALEAFEAALAEGRLEDAAGQAKRADACLGRVPRVTVVPSGVYFRCAWWFCEAEFVFDEPIGSHAESDAVVSRARAALAEAGWVEWTFAVTCPKCPGKPPADRGA